MSASGTKSAPLSPAQARLAFIETRDGPSAAYTTVCAFRLHGALDATVLEQAMQAVVNRHESLRTCVVVEGEPMQLIEPVVPVHLDRADVRDTTGAERAAVLERAVEDERRCPFDLMTVPLFRARLLQYTNQEHVLIISWHHIVCDAWSYNVFLDDLLASYDGLVQGSSDPLFLTPPMQYADVAERERRWMDSGHMLTQLSYWRQQLQGIPERLELPVDRPRPSTSSSEGAAVTVGLSREETDALKRWSGQHRLTFYVLLLAAYGVLLARYAGQDEVIVGMPVASRVDRDTQNVIGLLVNLLPIRVRPSRGMRSRELLGFVQEAVLGALRHQRIPFDRIVQEIAPARSPGVDPLCQAILTSLWSEVSPRRGLKVERLNTEKPAARFDLELMAYEQDGAAMFQWIYRTALFDRWRIEQQARHYLRVLTGLCAESDPRIGDIELLSADEREEIVRHWNATARPVPDLPLSALLEAQAARTPDAIAVVCSNRQVNYRDLNARANQLARVLAARGIGPGDVVALATPRSVELIVGLVAVLKAGAAYLPLDLSHPADRLSFMLADASTACMLTLQDVAARLPQGYPQLVLDDPVVSSTLDAAATTDLTDADRTRPLTPSCAAYVVYTSGTTGKPKGVVGLHRGTVNRLSWFADLHPLRIGEPLLARSSLAFVDASTELLGPLTSGGMVVLADDDAARDPSALNRLIARYQVTRVTVVPSLLTAMIREDAGEDLQSCRLWICSGEALPRQTAASFYARRPEARLLNLYGASEASADSLWAECTSSDVPLGRPIWNTQVYVLDEWLAPVPVGVTGELFVAGVGLARGYSRRPSLTAVRFIANPYGPPGSRIYRTGDLARWRRDGTLDFVGRRDDQVKIRGCRVEMREVQSVLEAAAGVSEAVVVMRPDRLGELSLVAYVVATTNASLSGAALRRRLADTVPSYMVPRAVVVLEQLPRTSSGKIDHRALPEPAPSAADHRSPETAEEAALCDMFAEVLGLDRICPDDDFFEFGGHSLLAVRLLNRIAARLGVNVPLWCVFEAPTPAALAEHVRQFAVASTGPVAGEDLHP